MKLWKKTLSVGLSLAMCASLVAPGFAASFSELQGAINTGESVYQEDGETYKIEASKDEETGAVNVKLYEKVEYENGDPASITIKGDSNVTLDLNGNDIDAQNNTGNSVIWINPDGELTLKDSTGREEQKTDEDGNLVVDEDGNPIMEYVSGSITGGRESGREGGGGVYNNRGTFTMDSGAIKGNYTSYDGGGVYNYNGTFVMNGGTITENWSGDGGGGVYNNGTFQMNGGTIEGNTVNCPGRDGSGGGVFNNKTFIMTGGTISGNKSYDQYQTGVGGGVASAGGTLTITGGTISGNTADKAGDEICIAGAPNLTIPEDSLWDTDAPTDRSSSVQKVYSGADLSSNRYGGSEGYSYIWLCLKHHVHNFENEEVITEPTCTEAGEVVYSGCYCGQTVTEEIPALGHDWGEWEVTTPAQVGVEGEETRVCARDDSHIETRPIPALETDPDSGKTDPTKPDPENPNPVNPDPTKPDPTKPDPENPNPVNPDPTKPDPVNPDSEEPVEIEDPDTPLGELPDEVVDIEDPETPLGELPEIIDIDDPTVPLGDVPQTGEASTALWLAVLLACGMGLVYVNTGKRKENA